MEEPDRKKIGKNIVLFREPGLLTVAVKSRPAPLSLSPGMRLLLFYSLLVFGLLAAFPALRGTLYRTWSVRWTVYAFLAVVCGLFYLGRMLMKDRQTLTVYQGMLRVSDRKFFIKYPSEFQTSEISDLDLNIPDGKASAGYRRFPFGLTGRIAVTGAIAFKYRGKIVEIAPLVDRVSATYILRELRRAFGTESGNFGSF